MTTLTFLRSDGTIDEDMIAFVSQVEANNEWQASRRPLYRGLGEFEMPETSNIAASLTAPSRRTSP